MTELNWTDCYFSLVDFSSHSPQWLRQKTLSAYLCLLPYLPLPLLRTESYCNTVIHRKFIYLFMTKYMWETHTHTHEGVYVCTLGSKWGIHPHSVAQESSQIRCKITRDFSTSCHRTPGTQQMQTEHKGFSSPGTCTLDAQLCPQETAGARKRFINILHIQTSDYNRLNYGKDMHRRACCYVACNCKSKPLAHVHLSM